MERNLSYDEVVECYSEFSSFIESDFNKQLVINTIDNCINSKAWPQSYYNLRDEYLPDIMGENASKFLFWFALGGLLDEQFDGFAINDSHGTFLKFLMYNYSEQFLRAKQFNINPLGFYQISFTHSMDNEMLSTYITRNDSEQFLLKQNVKDFSNMLTEALRYFSLLFMNKAVDPLQYKDILLENIEQMKVFLEYVENTISIEETLDVNE
ncbi:hypothetical protein H9636_15915 [Ureibacillus sp. Re31]|uniref:Uncharacterized protein n=1 Tax=Ureibacillus galli TaxID=2762222 RepID=A0ABR8XFX3_9BACL|nr:hypothetical protein [Ureibacillus galli]MBD8028134.1 hypothetical protein [Ureibacillus galli]